MYLLIYRMQIIIVQSRGTALQQPHNHQKILAKIRVIREQSGGLWGIAAYFYNSSITIRILLLSFSLCFNHFVA